MKRPIKNYAIYILQQGLRDLQKYTKDNKEHIEHYNPESIPKYKRYKKQLTEAINLINKK